MTNRFLSVGTLCFHVPHAAYVPTAKEIYAALARGVADMDPLDAALVVEIDETEEVEPTDLAVAGVRPYRSFKEAVADWLAHECSNPSVLQEECACATWYCCDACDWIADIAGRDLLATGGRCPRCPVDRNALGWIERGAECCVVPPSAETAPCG